MSQVDINNLDKQVAVLNTKLDNLDAKQDAILEMIKNHIQEETHRYDTIMDTKADRWVEKFAVGVISLICISVFGALIALVLR